MLDLEYGTDPFCNDTDHASLQNNDGTEKFVNSLANAIPGSVAEFDARAIKVREEIPLMVSEFIETTKWATNLVSVYEIRENTGVFAAIICERILGIYRWGIASNSGKSSETVVTNVWTPLQEHVVRSSTGSWYGFAEELLAEISGSNSQLVSGFTKDAGTVSWFTIVIGEWEPGDSATEAVVKHDVGRFYELPIGRGYRMIEIPGKPQNLRLTQAEINLTFVYLKEKLTAYPDAEVFMAFVGHGIAYADGDAAYVLSSKPDYFWRPMADRFDRTILDKNSDGRISDEEKNNPLYSVLIMVFCTCHSEYAIENFSQNDSGVKKRVLIAACGKNEVTGALSFPYAVGLFPTHFVNKCQGESGEEFLVVFSQTFFSVSMIGFVFGVVLSYYLPSNIFVLIAILLPIFVALIAAYDVSLYQARTIYDAVRYASKWTQYGLFYGLFGGSNPKIYNEEVAMVIDL